MIQFYFVDAMPSLRAIRSLYPFLEIIDGQLLMLACGNFKFFCLSPIYSNNVGFLLINFVCVCLAQLFRFDFPETWPWLDLREAEDVFLLWLKFIITFLI